MEKTIQLFCSTDSTGRITKILTGDKVIGSKSYQHFLMIDKNEQANLDKYRIENGQLVQIEGTTLIEVGNPNPSTEEQLAEVKKQLAILQQQLEALTPLTEDAPVEPVDETPVEEPTNPTE